MRVLWRSVCSVGLLAGACTLGARDDADLSGGGKGGGGGAAGTGGSDGGGGAGNCSAGTKDCDGIAQNGCETSIDKDPKNCGACGTVCASDGGKTPTCDQGKCGLSNCTAPTADCDGDGTCETDTSSSVDHCGFCEYKCALPNAKSVCANGCQVEECNSGFESCDGVPSNGCETPLTTDTNCGVCGAACSLANATASCSTGACAVTACNTGYGDCDKLPETGCESNTQTDPNNCGACGTKCSTGQVCQAGKCVVSGCTPPTADCDNNPANCETNTDTSLQHCGFCNNPCILAHATATCSAGKCAVASCSAGWADCDGLAANGCETQLNTTSNCKSCGDQCSGGPNVALSTCGGQGCSVTCSPGFSNCNASVADGCEVQLANDPLHCGSCTNNCSAKAPPGMQAACSNGACTYNCAAGMADCDSDGSCETNLLTSSTHCGSCTRSCGGTPCVGGFCQPEIVVAEANMKCLDADTTSASLVYGRSPGGVFRVNKTTKAISPLTTTQGASSVDVITTYTYFTDPTTGVFRVQTTGGPPSLIASVTGGAHVDADLNDVFFTTALSGGSLRRVDVFGGPIQVWEPQSGALAVRFDSGPGLVFWTLPALGEVRYSNDASPTSTQTLASGQGEPSFVKVDSQYVYWTATSDGAIRRANKPPGGNVTTMVSGVSSPYVIAQDPSHVYWGAKGAGGLWRVLKSGGPAEKLVDGGTAVVAIELDPTHVYFVDSAGLKRVPR